MTAPVWETGTTGRGWGGAQIGDATHRYLLKRWWGTSPPTDVHMLWIGLNASTATHLADDMTVTRVQEFSEREGAESFAIANLFAYRTPSPARLLLAAREDWPRAVGALNDETLTAAMSSALVIVAAWGAWGLDRRFAPRAAAVTALARRAGAQLHCLGVTRAGAPRHPCRLTGSAPLTRWLP